MPQFEAIELRTAIHSLEGAGRFVIGLAADVKILDGDALRGVHPGLPEKVHPKAGLLNNPEQIIEVVHNPVKELVHQLRLLLFRHVDDGFETFAGEPAGFGVGAAAAREYEDAGIGPAHGVEVGLEAFFGNGMGERSLIYSSGCQSCQFSSTSAQWKPPGLSLGFRKS